MAKTIKWILYLLLALIGLLLAWVVFNQFDLAAPKDDFKISDLRPAYFEKDNGFYLLFNLAAPAGKDIDSEEARLPIRRLFDPAYDNDRYIRELPDGFYKEQGGKWLNLWKKRKYPGDQNQEFARNGWMKFFTGYREEYRGIQKNWKELLDRYEKLLNAPRFEDFTLPRFDAPIPNLLIWLQLGKVYTAINALDAEGGQWSAATVRLIRQVDLARRVVAGSRTLILNLVAKGVMRFSLQGIVSIMNEKECPAEVFSLVLEKLPPLPPNEYGSRQSFISEYLYFTNALDGNVRYITKEVLGGSSLSIFLKGLFLQRNRTKRALLDFYQPLIVQESTPPHRWSAEDFNIDAPPQKGLWWLQNPVGKKLLASALPNIKVVVFKSIRLKVLHDLTRIIAELNLHYTPQKPVADILRTLPTYSQVMDPFTGQPYRYDGQKQILYSLGWDRKDDGGLDDLQNLKNSDIAAPCIPYYRTDKKKTK